MLADPLQLDRAVGEPIREAIEPPLSRGGCGGPCQQGSRGEEGGGGKAQRSGEAEPVDGFVLGGVRRVVHALHARGEQGECAPEEPDPVFLHPVAEQAFAGDAGPAELEEDDAAVASAVQRAPRQCRPLETDATAPPPDATINHPRRMAFITIGLGEAPPPVLQEMRRQPLPLGRGGGLPVGHAVHQHVVEARRVVGPPESGECALITRVVGGRGEEWQIPAGDELEDVGPARFWRAGEAQLEQQPAGRLAQVRREAGNHRLVGAINRGAHGGTVSPARGEVLPGGDVGEGRLVDEQLLEAAQLRLAELHRPSDEPGELLVQRVPAARGARLVQGGGGLDRFETLHEATVRLEERQVDVVQTRGRNHFLALPALLLPAPGGEGGEGGLLGEALEGVELGLAQPHRLTEELGERLLQRGGVAGNVGLAGGGPKFPQALQAVAVRGQEPEVEVTERRVGNDCGTQVQVGGGGGGTGVHGGVLGVGVRMKRCFWHRVPVLEQLPCRLLWRPYG